MNLLPYAGWLLLSLVSFTDLQAQIGPPNNKEEYDKMHSWRIRRDYINGVYIPRDLGEAFNELNKKIDKDSREKFKSVSEELAASKLHFSLGRWMIVNWSFYEGSRFAEFLKSAGITHPDDMARFTIITYHRYLNNKPLQVKELAISTLERRKKEHEERLNQGDVLHQETRKRPKEETPAKDQ